MVVTKPEANERTDEGEGIYNLLLKQFNVIYRFFRIIAVKLLKLFEPVHEKTNNLGSDQVRQKPACSVTEDG